MNRCVLLLAGLVAAVSVRAADVSLDASGALSFEGAGLKLPFVGVTNNWSVHGGVCALCNSSPSDTNGLHFALRFAGKRVGRGLVRLNGGGERLRCRFAYWQETDSFTYAGLMFRGPLETAATVGGGWSVDGKPLVPFAAEPAPQQAGRSATVFFGSVKRLTLDLPAVGRRLDFVFDEKTRVMIQDARLALGRFEIRFVTAFHETLKKGDKRVIDFNVSDKVPLACAYLDPYRPTMTEAWSPLDFRKDIVPGSVLDFSKMAHRDGPAGSHGWLRNVNGRFEFADEPGRVRRFSGANLCFGATVPTHEQADRLVRRFAAFGWNSMRLHHHDGPLTQGSADRLSFNAENLDRFDYFVAKMIENGIYVTTDLQVSRPVNWEDIAFPGQHGPMDTKGVYKLLTCFWEPAYRNWEAFAVQFMEHVNPYTGRRYADEPGMPFVSLVNEGSFRMGWPKGAGLAPVREAWSRWLAAKRAADANFLGGNVPDDPTKLKWDKFSDTGSAALALFMADAERDRYRRMEAAMRKLGAKALFTNLNHLPYFPPNHVVRAETYGYVDDHTYLDHPSSPITPWQDPMVFHDAHPFNDPQQRLYREPFHRVWGLPFTVSEWQFCGCNRYRSTAGLLRGALAAGQDASALWRFAYAHGLAAIEDNAGIPGSFDLLADPINALNDRAVTCLFLRGDFAPFEDAFALDLTQGACTPTNGLARQLAPAKWRREAVWKARVGVAKAGAPLPPGVAKRFDFDAAVVRETPPCDLRMGKGLDFDFATGRFAVVTARLAGGFAEAGAVDCGGLRFDVKAGGPTTLTAMSVDDAPLAASKRILVTHLTDALGKDARYSGPDRTYMLSHGTKPVMVKSGVAAVSLVRTDDAPCKVYAVGLDGARRFEVPVVRRDGRLSFEVRMAAPTGGAVLAYEVVAE